jgi:hypothetical protein
MSDQEPKPDTTEQPSEEPEAQRRRPWCWG